MYECSSVEEGMRRWRVEHRGESAWMGGKRQMDGWSSVEEGVYGWREEEDGWMEWYRGGSV